MLSKFINPKEDSLTAAVFTHLLHLPVELFWQIFCNACYFNQLSNNPGEPRLVAAWPNWKATGTQNAIRVIPDLFVRFSDFDLIVEAKRWDYNQQYREQWQKELVAYTNEYGEEKRKIEMIAVGGLHTLENDEVKHEWCSSVAASKGKTEERHLFVCRVQMCKWTRLLHECQRMRRELIAMGYQSSQGWAVVRILNDLIDLFDWHGFSTGLWFSDFSFEEYHLSNAVESYMHLLQNRRKELTAL